MKILKIYTDGRYIPSLRSGATSFVALKVIGDSHEVITESAKIYEVSIEEANDTYYNTNHKMEIQAIINALNWLRTKGYSNKCRVYVYTDNQNVQLAAVDWIEKWKERDWITSANTEVKNMVMWKKLDTIMKEFKSVYIQWVQGHNGDVWNERADELCKTIMTKELGYESSVEV